jgi:hypothetical protein
MTYVNLKALILNQLNYQEATSQLTLMEQTWLFENHIFTLQIACRNDWFDIIDYLIEKDELSQEDYYNCLISCVCNYKIPNPEVKVPTLKKLLLKCDNLYIPFYSACKLQYLPIIDLFLEKINNKDSQAGLIAICEIGNKDLLDYLIAFAEKNHLKASRSFQINEQKRYKLNYTLGLIYAFSQQLNYSTQQPCKGKYLNTREIILFLIIKGANINMILECNKLAPSDFRVDLDENDITYLYAHGVMFYGKYTALIEKYIVWSCNLPNLLDVYFVPVINSLICEYL